MSGFILQFKHHHSAINNYLAVSQSEAFLRPYPFEQLIHAGRQHDAGDDGAQQQDGGVDDSGHRGVLAVWAAAAQQTGGAAAQTRSLKTSKTQILIII